jgi:hypothetical protein
MKRELLRLVATVADGARDLSDRLHGWAIRKLTEDNLRQLRLDYRERKGWWR